MNWVTSGKEEQGLPNSTVHGRLLLITSRQLVKFGSFQMFHIIMNHLLLTRGKQYYELLLMAYLFKHNKDKCMLSPSPLLPWNNSLLQAFLLMACEFSPPYVMYVPYNVNISLFSQYTLSIQKTIHN